MTLRVAPCLVLLALTGCRHLEAPDNRQKFEVLIRVATPQGEPVQGAQITLEGKPIGATSDQGVSVLPFTSNEGDTYDLGIQCPTGLQSPSKPITVTLRKLADGKRPEFVASCAPTSQLVLVAVRTDNGPNLPILYLGNEIGRTDQAGAALVGLRLPPNESFELKIGTSEPGAEWLRPQSPSTTFPVKTQDDVLVYEQKFTIEKPKKVFVGKAKGPKRL